MIKLSPEEEQIKQTLKPQEAQTIMVMREYPYQIVHTHIEANKVIRWKQEISRKNIIGGGKVVHKERIESIKD